jgi:hypothetical protein
MLIVVVPSRCSIQFFVHNIHSISILLLQSSVLSFPSLTTILSPSPLSQSTFSSFSSLSSLNVLSHFSPLSPFLSNPLPISCFISPLSPPPSLSSLTPTLCLLSQSPVSSLSSLTPNLSLCHSLSQSQSPISSLSTLNHPHTLSLLSQPNSLLLFALNPYFHLSPITPL